MAERSIIDLRLVQNDNGIFDFNITNGGTEYEQSLDSLISYYLFTNAYDGKYAVNHRQGWKGGDLSSYLWQFDHSILNNEVSEDILDTIRNALEPLITQRICSDINVSGQIINQILYVTILYTPVSGNQTQKYSRAFELSGRR